MNDDIIYKSPINNVIDLSTDAKQQSEISNTTTINLPNVTSTTDFILFLNCTNDLEVVFHTDSDNQSTRLIKGYYKIEFSYFGDWIIKC